jgi:hypothetical protein
MQVTAGSSRQDGGPMWCGCCEVHSAAAATQRSRPV